MPPKETPTPASGYAEPREKADPNHRDAGQEYADRENQLQEERDEQARKQAEAEQKAAEKAEQAG